MNVDMCEIVLITSEHTDYGFYAAIFMELFKSWWEVLTIVLGCMRMSDDVSGAQLAGSRGALPFPFLKIEKISVIIGKNALIAFIHGLNVHPCSHLKCCFKST